MLFGLMYINMFTKEIQSEVVSYNSMSNDVSLKEKWFCEQLECEEVEFIHMDNDITLIVDKHGNKKAENVVMKIKDSKNNLLIAGDFLIAQRFTDSEGVEVEGFDFPLEIKQRVGGLKGKFHEYVA